MVRYVIKAIINTEIAMIVALTMIGSAETSNMLDRSTQEIEAKVVMVNLMAHSLRELGDIRVRSL